MCPKGYRSTVWWGGVGGIYDLIFCLVETNAFIQYNIHSQVQQTVVDLLVTMMFFFIVLCHYNF